MSQKSVGIVINRLLNDENLRARFDLDRIDTLAELSFLGIQLTSNEIDMLIQADARVWVWGSGMVSVGCTDDPPWRNR